MSLANKRVTVLGLGRFGGGIAVARWLVEQGARVTVSDRDSAEALQDSVAQLDGLPITFHLGEQPARDFTDTDLLVTSPAVKPVSDLLQLARDAGVPITTEICLFVERCRGRVLGVTGTKGKSTTTRLLGDMLSAVGPCYVGGNIGKSLLPELPAIDERTPVVLELSSYMLHWLGQIHWSPHVAVITMLGRDHLDWHGNAEAYLDAKRNITRYQRPGDRIVRRDDELSRSFPQLPGVVTAIYPDASIPPFELLLPGAHNQHNAQAAYLASGLAFEQAQQAVRQFRGLPHRLELVHEANGIRFYNDSIATIPEAAVIACDAFPAGRVIQIIGGSLKPGLSWDAMCQHLDARCRAVLCVGEIGPMLAQACGTVGEYVGTISAAVARAQALARPGDVVLLSPGTASYDQFANYEKRGERFAAEARAR